MKKTLSILVAVIILTVASVGIAQSEYNIPLEEGETLLLERELQDGSIEALVEFEEDHYRRLFENKDLNLISNEKLEKHGTGLITSDKQQDKDAEAKVLRFIDSKKGESNWLPPSIDYSYSPYLPEVGNQGMTNSCVAWAAGYYLRTYQQAKDLGWDIRNYDGTNNLDRVFSPSYIYNQIYIGNDEGAYFDDAYRLLQYQGVAALSDFPTISGDYMTRPNTATIERAYPHRVREYINLQSWGYNSNNAKEMIKKYLSIGELPIMGIFTGYNFNLPESYNGEYFVTTDYDLYNTGGHSVVVVGYDDKIDTPEGVGAFKIINSWGKDWADAGYGYITYEAFERHSYHFGYTIDLVNDEKPLEDVSSVTVEKLSDTIAKYTWDTIPSATGYKIYDENYVLIEEIIGENEYIEYLTNIQPTIRYIKAFNDIYESDLVEFTVNSQEDISEIIEYDRGKSIVLDTVFDQPIDKEWNVKFNRDVKYEDYLKDNVFVVNRNKQAQDIRISQSSDLRSLLIMPRRYYKPREIYTIVLKGVQDSEGKRLGQDTIMDFVVK